MNPLTTAVFALVLLYMLGVVVYAWRVGHRLQRTVMTRIVIGAIAFYAALELLLFAFYRDEPLSARGLWPNLLQGIWLPAYGVFWLRIPRSPVPDRYPYTPSRQDLRLIWLAMALPGLGLLAVFALLIAHAFTAHS